jgi:hypothetical protein
LISKGLPREQFPEPIVRIEQQANPKGFLRPAFARYEPDDVFGTSRVARMVSQEILMNNPLATCMTLRPPTDYDLRCTWLARQARNILVEIRQRHSTPEEICKFIYGKLLDEPPFDGHID